MKIHLLQLYIDKEYYEQAELMIDSFRHYLYREKSVLDSIKLSIFEFLKITGDLIKIGSAINDKDSNYKIDKIVKDIENMSNNRFGIKLC